MLALAFLTRCSFDEQNCDAINEYFEDFAHLIFPETWVLCKILEGFGRITKCSSETFVSLSFRVWLCPGIL